MQEMLNQYREDLVRALLEDAALRSRFESAPEEVAGEFGVTPAGVRDLDVAKLMATIQESLEHRRLAASRTGIAKD